MSTYDAFASTLQYLTSRGTYILRLGFSTKLPDRKWGGHRTIGTEDQNHEMVSNDLNTISGWFQQDGRLNCLGVITGEKSDLLMHDVDVKEGNTEPLESLRAMCAEHGFIADDGLPPTICTRSGNGGLHVWFKHREGLRNRAKYREGWDIRTDGGHAVLPGSTVSGKRYEFVPGHTPQDYPELVAMPDWLFDYLESLGRKNSSSSSGSISPSLSDITPVHADQTDLDLCPKDVGLVDYV